MRKLSGIVVAVVLTTGSAACSDDEPNLGAETPTLPAPQLPQSSAPAQPGLPHSGAPKVETPIADTSAWEADPCTVISAQQLQTAGFNSVTPKRDDTDTGVGCLWEFDPESASIFTASLGNTGGMRGLSNIYQLKDMGQMKQFEVLPAIEGLPAVVAGPEDETADGLCSVAVGLRDDLVFGVDMAADPSVEQGKDPCGWAVKVATLAVQTMKGGS